MVKSVLGAGLFAATLTAAAATPETSRLFQPFTDPQSGVTSYLLKPGLVGHNQQSIYFTAKSMTEDGRFLVLDVSCDESLPKEKRAWTGKRKALVDFEKDDIFMLGKDTRSGSDVPCLDTERDQFYYFRLAPGDDRRKDALCRRDLLVDPLKEIEVCRMPLAITADATNFVQYSTHPTLTRDRKRMFIGYIINKKYGQGCIRLEDGGWEPWGLCDFYSDHDQINPANDKLAMVAWEACWGREGKAYKEKTGWYPRMWFAYPDGRRELIPSRKANSASHEIWDDDGGGITWCGHGVWHMDLKTRRQTCLVPGSGLHAMQSHDLKYCVFDNSTSAGWWRGCPWQVCFVNNLTKKRVMIYSASHVLTPKGTNSTLHPDAHPQFVCKGKYVVSTFNDRPGGMTVCVTPVAPLVERTSTPPPATAAPVTGANALSNWPAGTSPAEISRRITDQFLSTRPENYRPLGYYGNEGYGWNRIVQYSVVSLWINALECARLTGDKERTDRLLKLFDDFRPFKKRFRVCSPPYHVDDSIFGALPYEIHLLTGDRLCLEMGNWYADLQWDQPNREITVRKCGNASWDQQWKYYRAGLSPQTRLWIDDMYMITALQSQAYRATGDRKYIERAAKEMCFYLDKLQLKDGAAKGLFYHAPSVPYVWARGAGWMAAGMALVLDCLPENSVHRARIMSGYRLMMEALLRYQRPDGLWCQLVDRPDEPENWAETSGTAMYAFAFSVGIRRGWLDASIYGPAFRKAYLSLCDMLDCFGNLPDVCEGTGIKNDKPYYYARKRVNGDPHGQAPMLWICGSLMAND